MYVNQLRWLSFVGHGLKEPFSLLAKDIPAPELPPELDEHVLAVARLALGQLRHDLLIGEGLPLMLHPFPPVERFSPECRHSK